MDPEKKSHRERGEIVASNVPDEKIDGKKFVRMSGGDVIRPGDMSDYLETFEPGARPDDEHSRKLDALFVSSVAGLSAAALALAYRRLHKKQ